MRLCVEVEGSGELPPLPGEGATLVALMSFAVSRGFGATHPLIALADRLHDVHRVPMGPLTTFYERTPEDAEDREKLELAWQNVADLRRALEALVAACDTDPMIGTFARRAGALDLREQAAALAARLSEPALQERRVRLVYDL